MNKHIQTVMIFFLIVLILIPAGVVAKHYSLDKYSILANEGFVASNVAGLYEEPKEEEKPAPTPQPETPKVTTCSQCGGTKKVKTGDGLANIPCPCGENCKCVGMVANAPKLRQKLVLVTAVDWCQPCKQIDSSTIPALRAMGWRIKHVQDPEENPHIEIVGDDRAAEFGVNTFPTWIVFVDGKETVRRTGYLNGYGVGHLWEGKSVLQSDLVMILWKK